MAEISDEQLHFLAVPDNTGWENALLDGEVSAAWMIWSSAAEGALVDAFSLTGGSIPCEGLVVSCSVVRAKCSEGPQQLCCSW